MPQLTKSKPPKPSEIIADALALLMKPRGPYGTLQHSWTRRQPHGTDANGNDTFCALGALSGAAEGIKNANDIPYQWSEPAHTAARLGADAIPSTALLRCGLGQADPSNIPLWNDNKATTFTEVKAVFCRALKRALRNENPDRLPE